jgi:hypothetical protein
VAPCDDSSAGAGQGKRYATKGIHQMTVNVFLSHNHADKEFVRKLAKDLDGHGMRYWLDEAEMKIGDSLIQKIREGIDSVDFFAVILSPNPVNAPWVVNELDIAVNYQINGKPIKVLPLLLLRVPSSFFDFPGSVNFRQPARSIF